MIYSELNIGKVFHWKSIHLKLRSKEAARHQPYLVEIEFHQEPYYAMTDIYSFPVTENMIICVGVNNCFSSLPSFATFPILVQISLSFFFSTENFPKDQTNPPTPPSQDILLVKKHWIQIDIIKHKEALKSDLNCPHFDRNDILNKILIGPIIYCILV